MWSDVKDSIKSFRSRQQSDVVRLLIFICIHLLVSNAQFYYSYLIADFELRSCPIATEFFHQWLAMQNTSRKGDTDRLDLFYRFQQSSLLTSTVVFSITQNYIEAFFIFYYTPTPREVESYNIFTLVRSHLIKCCSCIHLMVFILSYW